MWVGGLKVLCLLLKCPDKLGLWVKTPLLILFFDSQLHFLLYLMRVIVVFNTTSFVCRIALLRLFTVVILTPQSWACFSVGFCLFACSLFPFICLVQTSYCPSSSGCWSPCHLSAQPPRQLEWHTVALSGFEASLSGWTPKNGLWPKTSPLPLGFLYQWALHVFLSTYILHLLDSDLALTLEAFSGGRSC